MIRIDNITTETHQIHTVIFEDGEIELALRFFPRAQMWAFDVEYRGRRVDGVKLSLGVLHMESSNLPFDFAVVDTSDTGIDPFKIDDFAEGRCILYMLQRDDIEAVRGAPVPI